MTHNETRISNERLAEMLADIGKCQPFGMMSYGPGDIASLREALSELQELRSTPVEAEPLGFVSRKEIGLLKEWSGGDYVAGVSRRSTTRRDIPVYTSHPLPNPSPSDGEVSEATLRVMALSACRTAWPQFNSFGIESKSKRLSEMLTALQSKRGQP